MSGLQPARVGLAELKEAVEGRQAMRFYAARGWQPAWDEPAAAQLLAALAEAPRHALSRTMFLDFAMDSGPAD